MLRKQDLGFQAPTMHLKETTWLVEPINQKEMRLMDLKMMELVTSNRKLDLGAIHKRNLKL